MSLVRRKPSMTGEDFEVLLAVGACATPPADGRPPLDYITLERVLGARYSGDPYDRGIEWEDAVPNDGIRVQGRPMFTNRERTDGSLRKLVELGLVDDVEPPEYLADKRLEVYEITTLGRTMLACAGVTVPPAKGSTKAREVAGGQA